MRLLSQRRRVTFLTWNVYGIGGIARVVINVANELAKTHDVEVLSILRANRESTFPIDERVRVTTLFDSTRGAEKWRRNHPDHPRVIAAGQCAEHPVLRREPVMNALIERRLREHLAATDADVVVSTRPTLHGAAIDLVRSNVGLIGWDHLNFETRYGNTRMGRLLDAVVPELDVWVTLTEGDRDDYRARMGERLRRVEVMRNSSGWVAPEVRPPRTEKVVVAGGRLHHRKGFDRAIQAWEPLGRSHPDWQLHIYGSGPSQPDLQKQIDDAGLTDQVRMMGYTKDFKAVLAAAEIFLMTSRAEGFPMVLVEAMSQGASLVSMDCPRGPAEIVRSGHNGELLPDGDVAGVSKALARMFDDAALRQRMGEQAMEDSRAYQMDVIAERWRALIDDVAARGEGRRLARRAVAAARRRIPVRG